MDCEIDTLQFEILLAKLIDEKSDELDKTKQDWTKLNKIGQN